MKDSEYVIVLDPPEVPLIRSHPQRRKIVTMAGFLGLLISIALGLLNDYIGNKINAEKEKFNELKSLFIKNAIGLISFAKSEK